MSNQLAVREDELGLNELGQVFAKSGFFSDTRDAAQAIVKVLAGREMGFKPVTSMMGVYIIKGRVSISANLMGAAVKNSGRYNYRVITLDDKACEIAFFEGGQEVGRSRFTAEDARKAGTQNMDKFPRNMLFARAMSNGAKWYCPDIFSGPVYTPEELGARVNEEGEVIDMPAQPVTQAPQVTIIEPPAAPAPAPANGDAPASDAAWAKFNEVVETARSFDIDLTGMLPDDNATTSQLRDAYKAINAKVKALGQVQS